MCQDISAKTKPESHNTGHLLNHIFAKTITPIIANNPDITVKSLATTTDFPQILKIGTKR
jgi:hypothetical protein